MKRGLDYLKKQIDVLTQKNIQDKNDAKFLPSEDYKCKHEANSALDADEKCSVENITRPAILLTTGAMAPTHRMHVRMMRYAHHAATGAGYTVDAAFLSPSHDNYVLNKLRQKGFAGITGEMRLEMCQLLLSDASAFDDASWNQSSCFTCDDWEITQPAFVDFPLVYAHFEQKYPAHTIFYVCGADHASYLSSHMNVIVLSRPGSNYQPSTNRKGICILCHSQEDIVNPELSSTNVRQTMLDLKAAKECNDMIKCNELQATLVDKVGKNVASYIEDYVLAKLEQI